MYVSPHVNYACRAQLHLTHANVGVNLVRVKRGRDIKASILSNYSLL